MTLLDQTRPRGNPAPVAESSEPAASPRLADRVRAILAHEKMDILHELVDIERPATCASLHPVYEVGSPCIYRDAKLGKNADVWRHQGLALDFLAEGANVITTTPTASGKSFIFQMRSLYQIDQGGTVIVLYPIKALAADQKLSWQKAIRSIGLPDDTVGEITGDTAMTDRLAIAQKARILLMTPDILHTWFMGNIDLKILQGFLRRLRLLVIDEARVFDSVLGSSSAFLFRRVFGLAHAFRSRTGEEHAIQVAASSATIPDASEHMEALFGMPFKCIDEMDDGSPRHRRSIMHVQAQRSGLQKEVQKLTSALMRTPAKPVIVFCDSRIQVERISSILNNRSVFPYRQGYELSDRARIETGLREGRLQAVVSTSALEMGIDIPLLQVGINVDGYASRRSIRQRIGRVGRAGEGVFIVLADANQFQNFDESFEDYVRGEVERTCRYLENRFLQYQHARCLLYEVKHAGVALEQALQANISWPAGFRDLLAEIDSPESIAEFADLSAAIRGRPHYAFGLRSIGETSLDIIEETGNRLGTASYSTGMREAYPGGTYTHLKQNYKVKEWRRAPYPAIIVRKERCSYTSPVAHTYVNARIDGIGILNDHFYGGGERFMAECSVAVKQTIEGYNTKTTEGPIIYAEEDILARTIATTGIILKIPELDDLQDDRYAIGHEIMTRFKRLKGIGATDVDLTVSPIGIRHNGFLFRVNSAIAIYDTLRGSLRLTEALYDNMPMIIRQVLSGTSAVGRNLAPTALDSASNWWRALDHDPAPLVPPSSRHEAGYQVIPEGATVLANNRPGLPLTVVEPVILFSGGIDQLAYVCRSPSGRHMTISSARLVTSVTNRLQWSPLEPSKLRRQGVVDLEVTAPS